MSVEITPSGKRGQQMPGIARILMRPMTALAGPLYGVLGRRIRMRGLPIVLLHTVGAKTDKPRQTLLIGFPDGDNAWLIVASAGGSARHPAWFYNLAKHPEQVWIEVGKRKLKVRPESLKGAEREQSWQSIVARSPQYAGYQENTDREIPVVRLTKVTE